MSRCSQIQSLRHIGTQSHVHWLEQNEKIVCQKLGCALPVPGLGSGLLAPEQSTLASQPQVPFVM